MGPTTWVYLCEQPCAASHYCSTLCACMHVSVLLASQMKKKNTGSGSRISPSRVHSSCSWLTPAECKNCVSEQSNFSVLPDMNDPNKSSLRPITSISLTMVASFNTIWHYLRCIYSCITLCPTLNHVYLYICNPLQFRGKYFTCSHRSD